MPDTEPMFLTPRLLVRHFDPSDLEDFAALCADPVVMQYCGDGEILERDMVVRWIEVCQQRYRDRGYGTSAVFERDSGDFIGYCGVIRPDDQDFDEVVYVFHQAFWGKGYATEVAGPMISYVFDQSDLDEIWATIDLRNTTSVGVAQKLGMQLIKHVDEENDVRIGHFVKKREPVPLG